MSLAASWNDFVNQFWETLIWLISPGVVEGFLLTMAGLLFLLGPFCLVWLIIATVIVARRISDNR